MVSQTLHLLLIYFVLSLLLIFQTPLIDLVSLLGVVLAEGDDDRRHAVDKISDNITLFLTTGFSIVISEDFVIVIG